jgi:hypothetical protein
MPAAMKRRQVLRVVGAAGLSAAGLTAAGVSAVGCAGSPSLVPIGGEHVDAATIDKDPLALLPKGIIVLATLDLVSLYSTDLGRDAATIAQALVPLGPESNFSPQRDTSKVVGGLYAMQGVDFCAVVSGRFDVAAIGRAADARAAVPSGTPLVKTRYGDFDLYTVGNIGFVLLTPSTMISGNETGMRRALDRLRYQRLARALPQWMTDLADTKNASLSVAGDFGADTVVVAKDGQPAAEPTPSGSPAEPVLEAASATYPFLSGLRALRIVGNFQSPGLNLAGSLTYSTAEKAQQGAVGLRQLADLGSWVNLLASFGLGAALAPAQIAVQGGDVAVVQPVDTTIARAVLGLFANTVRR